MDIFASTKEEALELRRVLRRKTGKKHHITKCIGGYDIWPYSQYEPQSTSLTKGEEMKE